MRDLSRRTHGKRSTYRDGCRCERCRDAENAYQRERYRVRGRADRGGHPRNRGAT